MKEGEERGTVERKKFIKIGQKWPDRILGKNQPRPAKSS